VGGDGGDQFGGLDVGVVDHVFEAPADHRPQAGRRAQRVDVRAEVEDPLGGQTG